MAYGLLLLRVVFGLTIAAHGAQKLFGWFGGGGLNRWGQIFGTNYQNGVLMAALAGMSELGGVAFAIGLLTPLAALGMVVVMVTAIRVVTWQNGFFHSNGGFEFNLALLAGAVAIVMTGPGRFSVDHALGIDDNASGLWWGLGVLAIGVVIAFVNHALFFHASDAQPSET